MSPPALTSPSDCVSEASLSTEGENAGQESFVLCRRPHSWESGEPGAGLVRPSPQQRSLRACLPVLRPLARQIMALLLPTCPPSLFGRGSGTHPAGSGHPSACLKGLSTSQLCSGPAEANPRSRALARRPGPTACCSGGGSAPPRRPALRRNHADLGPATGSACGCARVGRRPVCASVPAPVKVGGPLLGCALPLAGNVGCAGP